VVEVGCEAVRFMSPVPAAKQNQLKRIAGAKFQLTQTGSFIRDFALCRRRLLRFGGFFRYTQKNLDSTIINFLKKLYLVITTFVVFRKKRHP